MTLDVACGLRHAGIGWMTWSVIFPCSKRMLIRLHNVCDTGHGWVYAQPTCKLNPGHLCTMYFISVLRSKTRVKL